MKDNQKDPFFIPIVCAFVALVLVIGISIYSYKVLYEPVPIQTVTIQSE